MIKYLSIITILVCLTNDMFTNGHSVIKDQEDPQDKIVVYKSKHSNEIEKLLRMTREIEELEFKNNNNLLEMSVEFIEHPVDTLIPGKSVVQIQCSAKHAERVQFECGNKVREDAKRNISIKDSIKYETLSLTLRKKDLETKNSFNSFGISKKIICKCVAYTKNNEKILSNKAVIRNSYLDEDFQSEPMDEVAYTGDTVEMRCDPPKGEPTPTVYWLKNNQEINTNSDSSRYKLSNDYSLLILLAMSDDADYYICVATNQFEKRLSKPARLTLIDSSKKYYWSEWSPWTECPLVKCGQTAVSKRYRNCQTIDKLSQTQNVSLALCEVGPSIEDKTCEIKPCTVESQWSQWSQWSPCTNDCKQFKRRFCTNSVSQNCFGEKQIIRNCDSTKCVVKQDLNPEEKIPINKIQQTFNHLGNNTRSFLSDFKLENINLTIGLLSTVLLLILIIGLIILYFKRKTNRKNNKRSEINLYYTCEKQMPVDDSCSIFKFSKGICAAGSTSSSTSSSSVPVLRNNSDGQKPRIFENMFANEHIYHGTNIERQLLLENIQQQQQQQQHLFNSNQQQNYFMNLNHNLETSKNSPFKPLNQHSNNNSTLTTNSSSSSSSSNSKHNPPSSYMTKTSMLSASPSSNIYYEAPSFKINSPSLNSNYRDLNNDRVVLKNQIQQPNYMNLDSKLIINPFHKDEPELAYEVADALNIFSSASLNLPNNIDSSDICIGRVSSLGAKLSLDCGLSLIIPEGALSVEQSVTMYLALNRQESYKPKLNDKNTLLSEIIMIGPQNITLLKPVILVMDHCVKNINQDWLITLYSAFNTIDNSPEWREDHNITSDNSTNLNVFLNATESNFLLMTDKLGRYCLTGETKSTKQTKASKYFRLITFCSSCITNNDFNLRIYCVDNLLSALQEVLLDEKKIGGTLLETSEPFAISSSHITESLSICIDELSPDCLNCKYNVNRQEIPLSHIWNERNHLLHCSFTLEINDSLNEQFKCKIKAYQSNNQQLINVSMNINYNLKNLFYLNEKNTNEILAKRLLDLDTSGVWPKSSKLIQSSKNQSQNYNKIERNLKKKICTVLDETSNHEKNWRMLAQTLAINRNLHYFASKTSPTDMLLLYFEAISDLKANELNDLNNSKSEQTTPAKQSAASLFCLSNDNIFLKTFLNNFMETLKINEDLVKLIYTEQD